jgi:hypothetical protein
MPPGHPTEQGQHAALDLSPAHRRPELFVSGECLAEGPRQTLQTILHEAVHALAPCPWGQGHFPGWQVPQQARVRRPRRRAGPGLARRPAAASGDRLLRGPADRADRGGLRRHPDVSGCGHPPVSRHLPPPRATRRPRPRGGPGWSGWRRAAAERQDGRAVQGRLRLPAAPVVLDPGQAIHPRANHLRRLRPRLPTPGRRPLEVMSRLTGLGPTTTR